VRRFPGIPLGLTDMKALLGIVFKNRRNYNSKTKPRPQGSRYKFHSRES
jgi:hypothetical protein